MVSTPTLAPTTLSLDNSQNQIEHITIGRGYSKGILDIFVRDQRTRGPGQRNVCGVRATTRLCIIAFFNSLDCWKAFDGDETTKWSSAVKMDDLFLDA